MCRVFKQDDGFWIFHKNKIDVSSTFAHPEEKLWFVVKDHWRQPQHSDCSSTRSDQDDLKGQKKGIRLYKNSVIRLGKFRLRVRDIDNDIDSFPAAKLSESLPRYASKVKSEDKHREEMLPINLQDVAIELPRRRSTNQLKNEKSQGDKVAGGIDRRQNSVEN